MLVDTVRSDVYDMTVAGTTTMNEDRQLRRPDIVTNVRGWTKFTA